MDKKPLLQIGDSINIKRTDGRVHSAVVSAISQNVRTATVEWFEHNETKGKEVDANLIIALNPDVIFPCNELISPTHLSNVPTSSIAPNTDTSSVNSVMHSKAAKIEMNRSGLQQLYPTTSNGHATSTHIESRESSGIPINKIQNFKRISSVVQNVDQLKKNREERRQRQAEEKAEKLAFLKTAPDCPHYDLKLMISDYRRGLDIHALTDNDVIEDHRITVCVRKRPLNRKEVNKNDVDVLTIPSKNQLIVHEPKNKVDLTKYLENQVFRFDYAFDETCTNEMVYRYTAQPLISTVFDGGFATCFAYGQTGSGKTHTMGGDFHGKVQQCEKGIYAMVTEDVFHLANSAKYQPLGIVVSASFFEIYSGKVFDLLNNKAKLRVLEDGKQQVQVMGLTEKVVSSIGEVIKLLQKGNVARTSGQTSANANSSRSHAVFQLYLRRSQNMHKIHGKFSLIDLAGNERGADTSSANRQTRMEGAEINKSLLALKECIRALGRKGGHLPFRVSKLTQVLRDSFVGSNSRTCMIAMVSPGVNSCEHTLNSLRYADRVKELGAGDVAPMSNNNDASSPDDGDLAHLRSLNENDMSADLLSFHQVVSELEIVEEIMLDNHKQFCEVMEESVQQAKALLKMADAVAYDQEAYSNNWEELLTNMSMELTKANDIIADFKAKLSAEEQLSRRTGTHREPL